MSPFQSKPVGTRLRGMMSAIVGQIVSALREPAGRVTTLPTKAQLMKMGPPSELTRRSPHSNVW